MTVAYSDTFPVAGGCHCNRLSLYNIFRLEVEISKNISSKLCLLFLFAGPCVCGRIACTFIAPPPRLVCFVKISLICSPSPNLEQRIRELHKLRGIFNLKFPQALAPSFHHIYLSNWARLKALVILFKWVYGSPDCYGKWLIGSS